MDRLGVFLSAFAGLITAFGGLEFIKYIMNKKHNDRMLAAEAFQAERNAIMEDYKRIQAEVDRMQGVIDELRKRVCALEETRLDLIKENNELRLALKEAEHNICVRPDDECFKGRMPPRTYCRLKKLAQGDYDAFYEEEEDEKEKTEPKETKEN